MLTMNLVPVLLTLVLATGQLILSPHNSAATALNTPLPVHDRLGTADTPTPVAASDNFIRVANAPQATETCSETWEKTVSHQSWRCIDGFWYKVDFEQWSCKKPQKIVDHTHQQRTQEACSTSS